MPAPPSGSRNLPVNPPLKVDFVQQLLHFGGAAPSSWAAFCDGFEPE